MVCTARNAKLIKMAYKILEEKEIKKEIGEEMKNK